MEAKYERIKNDIIDKIQGGLYQPGEKIYSESDIKNKYNVSSITAVKALQELVSEGYIIRIQGKGSFVSKRKRNELVKFTDLEFSPDNETVKVLSAKKATLQDLPNDIEPGKYIKIERIKENGGTPYNYIQSFISSELINANNLLKEKLVSVYDRVFADSNVDLLRQNYKQIVKIVYPVKEQVEEKLGVKHAPSVKQIMRNYDKDSGKLLEYTISYKRWEYYSILFESPELN